MGGHARSENLAARMGRWSSHHRKKAIFGWLAFVIVAFGIGSAAGTKLLEEGESGVGQSGQAEKAVFDSFPNKADESVLVQSNKVDTSDPRFRATVADVT